VALASTRELLNNWVRIVGTVFPVQSGPEFLLSRPVNSSTSDELSLFIYLGVRLSISSTEAWASTVLRRIHAAHFDHLYTAAVEDARRGQESSFFRLSDERLRQNGQVPVRKCYKGYGWSSTVIDRLVDLMFLDPQHYLQISKQQCRKRINLTQQDGKRWRRLISCMGYKILLCLPPEITDNRFVPLYVHFSVYITHVLLCRMKLTDAQMDLLVPACEERLGQLDKAHLVEFE
jgi:hypothetical protein